MNPSSYFIRRFSDVTVTNDALQVKIIPPTRLTMWKNEMPKPKRALQVFELLIDHPDTRISVVLRGIKNQKEAAFSVEIEGRRGKYRDSCLVFFILHIVIHRLKYYSNSN